MIKKIKKIGAITLVMYLVAIFIIVIMSIWDILDNESVNEAIMKISLTFGAILIVLLTVLAINYALKDNNKK